MTDIAPVTHLSIDQAASITSAGDRSAGGVASGPTTAREADRVEVSPMARFRSLLREMPEIREDLVADVRGLIEAGAYETPERLDGAIEALIDEEPGLFEEAEAFEDADLLE